MYEKIYYFCVLDKIKCGNTVYCCDRQAKEVFCVNNLDVVLFVDVLNTCETDDDRFEFWIEKEGVK